MLELGIECMRFENIYSCNTHNNINLWLIKKNKMGKFQIWPNWMLIWVSVPVQAQYTLFFTGFFKKSHPLYDQTGGSSALLALLGKYL
jgi:hypothetical protein